LPHARTLDLPGLAHPVSVAYDRNGVPTIDAADDDDLFVALGYVQASFRLSEMDLERRLGEGHLAALAGSSDVSSDEFELRLGLVRTAQEEWAATPRSSVAGRALTGFSRGVNDYIAHTRATRDWPALFSLTGVYPTTWTPVDSLVIQGVLTQEMDFTTTPLDYEVLEKSLGAARTMAWFPVDAPNAQTPYDPGPYKHLGVTALAADAASTADGSPTATTATTATTAGDGAARLLAQIDALPSGQIHRTPASNAWAANGPAIAGGGAMLAGDPHLPQTLPSIWYQVVLNAPGFSVSGVSVPGLPGILIGHNAHISWSLTDVQNESTLYYDERTRPGQYYWRGAWRPMRQATYTIGVRGGAPVHLTVNMTVHGPIMTQVGQSVSVDWMGAVPSGDLAAMSGVSTATDFAQFRQALAGWHAPTLNFVYADDAGNIGAISPGYYPQVASGQPWLPLSGTGADDVTGVIPYAAVPQVYDPPGHVVATANQRPVGADYPYYIGTSADFFDPGYRAGTIYSYLRGHSAMTMADFASLQTGVTDGLAVRVLPALRSALASGASCADCAAAARLLGTWNGDMDVNSPAATLWWTFWGDYLSAVFEPWWKATHVPVSKDPGDLTVGPGDANLDEVLEAWTLNDPSNPAFTPPAESDVRTAPGAMRSAFAQAVNHLAATLRGGPSSWTWGRVHARQFPSLTNANALGYGPRASSGDPFTVNAADGGLTATAGPSWRMIADWSSPGHVTAEDSYPGGQSENPASPWYETFLGDWWNGRYVTMPPLSPSGTAGAVRWSLRPGGAK
jgi:penicillin amidase